MTPESKFQKEVVKVAVRLGWRYYHANNPRRDRKGFPDLVMVRRGRVLFAELKRDAKAKRNEVSEEQEKWLFELKLVQTNVEFFGCCSVQAHLWCPDDWDEIYKALN